MLQFELQLLQQCCLSTSDAEWLGIRNTREKRFPILNILSINLPHQFSSYLVNLFNYVSDLLFSSFFFLSYFFFLVICRFIFRPFTIPHFPTAVFIDTSRVYCVTCFSFYFFPLTHILIYGSSLTGAFERG